MFVALPASPRNDQIRVDFAKEVLSSWHPAIKICRRCVLLTRLLLVLLGSCHANILGQELNENLQIVSKMLKLHMQNVKMYNEIK